MCRPPQSSRLRSGVLEYLPLSLWLRMWNLSYLVEPGSIAVTRQDFIRSHKQCRVTELKGNALGYSHNLGSLKWGNETLLLLPCHRAQDLRMQVASVKDSECTMYKHCFIDPFTVYVTGKFEVRSAHVGVRTFIPSHCVKQRISRQDKT